MLAATSTAAKRATASLARPAAFAVGRALLTTYSGGQPIEGQGGYYGSIKTRSEPGTFYPGARAEPQDVSTLAGLMHTWETEKAALRTTEEQEQALRAIASDQQTVALLKRLVVRGAPAWGLSSAQREFVSKASRASA